MVWRTSAEGKRHRCYWMTLNTFEFVCTKHPSAKKIARLGVYIQLLSVQVKREEKKKRSAFKCCRLWETLNVECSEKAKICW